MKFLLTIPEDKRRAVKAAAALLGITMNEYINRAIDDLLETEQPTAS